MKSKWLEWAAALNALAGNGLAFAPNPFDRERFEKIRSIAQEIVAAHSDLQAAEVVRWAAHDTGYLTPKVDVRAAIFDGDRILLVHERSNGLWALPGGWADVNDSPSEAILREVLEEAGYKARIAKLAALYDLRRHGHPPLPFHAYKLFFICEIISGAPQPNLETDSAEFFAENCLPELSTSRVTLQEIQRMFEHYRQPNLPTDVD